MTGLVGVGQGDKVETVRKQPPKRLETLENLLQQAEHYSEYMMTGRSASVPPTLMALTPEGFIMHIPNRFKNETDKEHFAKTIRLKRTLL